MRCEYCDNQVPDDITICPCCGAHIERSTHVAASPHIDSDSVLSNKASQVIDPHLRGRSVDGAGRGWVKMQLDNVENDSRLEQDGDVGGRSRVVYVLLAMFFGIFGFHNFYAGYIMRGVVQLVLTLISFGWLGIFVFLWAVIEAIAVRKDAEGKYFG